METETILHTALFSGVLGFAVFCASYGFHVWRSRNAALAAKSGQRRSWSDRLPAWSAAVGVLGILLLLVTFIWRQAKPYEGVLSGDGLFTVRGDDELRLEFVTGAKNVQEGDVLARFRSPERQAELAALQIKRRILDTQRRIIELQPLVPDGELVRRYEKLDADQRQLFASLVHMIPEKALVLREKLRDHLDKTERINALTTRIDDARRELEQATARRDLARAHVERAADLSDQGAAAQIELKERSTDQAVCEAEVARLETCIRDMELERRHLTEAMPRFENCAAKQAEEIDTEISRIRETLAMTRTELAKAGNALTADARRAEQLKAQMLGQVELEILECQSRMDAIQDVLVIKAPFEGIVAYADPAPRMALPLAPVLVIAPTQGFRFRVRVQEAEARALSKTDTVALGLIDSVLQRRFPGKILNSEPLPLEPGYVLAELSCMPPPETIRDLASRDWNSHDWQWTSGLKGRLIWRPPVSTSPLFLPALVLGALGWSGWFLALLSRGRGRTKRAGSQPGLPDLAASLLERTDTAGVNSLPFAADATIPEDIESGALGRHLHLIGQRFREAIQRGHLEPSLLRTVEWSLDRHGMRAIQALGVGMDHDPEFPAALNRFLAQAGGEAEPGASISKANCTYDRVIRIVRTVAPHCLTAGVHRAKADGHSEVANVVW